MFNPLIDSNPFEFESSPLLETDPFVTVNPDSTLGILRKLDAKFKPIRLRVNESTNYYFTSSIQLLDPNNLK